MPRRLAREVLEEVDRGIGTAREILDAAPALAGMDPRDRDLVREVVYGTLRRRVTLDHILAAKASRRLASVDPAVRAALRAAAYQVLFLDRVPAPAAVDETVGDLRRAAGKRAAGFANAVLRALAAEVLGRGEGEGDGDPRRTVPTGDGRHVLLSGRLLPDPARDPDLSLAVRWSMPRWIVKRWRENLGEADAVVALRASAARPATWLRPVPGGAGELRAALDAGGVSFEEDGESPQFLLRGAGAVEELPGYARGLFTVQDPAAARAVALLDPRPGDAVLEIGAGRGGKTADLAFRVAPGGRVVAVDADGAKLAFLRATLARLRADPGVVEILEADALAEGTLPPGPFDLVLVDAPCTNTGVLARRVEARHRLRPQDVEALAAKGRRLLEAGLSRLRPGGRAVQSVCSLEPEEGPLAVRRAIRRAPRFTLAAEERLLPVPGRRDGGYAAVVRSAGTP